MVIMKGRISDMYQQQTPQPRDEGNWSGVGAEYQTGYAGNPEQRDQLADAIARRLQSHAPASLQAPPVLPYHHVSKASPAQRVALAIVSIAMLVPLAAISLSILGPFAGIIALGILCAVILGINFTFNMAS
jgi:hypothetical protein